MEYGIYSLADTDDSLDSSYYIVLKECKVDIYLVYLIKSSHSHSVSNNYVNHFLSTQLQLNLVDLEYFMELHVKYIQDDIFGYLGKIYDSIGENLINKYEQLQII